MEAGLGIFVEARDAMLAVPWLRSKRRIIGGLEFGVQIEPVGQLCKSCYESILDCTMQPSTDSCMVVPAYFSFSLHSAIEKLATSESKNCVEFSS